MRTLPTLTLPLIALLGHEAFAQGPVPMVPTGPDAGTGFAAPMTRVVMAPGEFRIDAVDAARATVTLRVNAELAPNAQRGAVRFGGPQVVPFRLPRDILSELIEAEKSGEIGLQLDVERVETPEAGQPSPPAPLLKPRRAELTIGNVQVADARLPAAGAPSGEADPTASGTPAFSVGEVEGEPHLSEEAAAQVQAAALHVAQRCAARLTRARAGFRGAMTIELTRAATGEAEPPRIVVDAAVCRRLEGCLTDLLADDTGLWSHLEAGQHAFVPFYFSGGSEPGSGGAPDGGSGPAVSGSVSP